MALPVRMLSVLVVAMVAAAHSTPPQQEEDMGDCIDDNGRVCGSRGLCIHGKCQCQGPFSGRHCQDLWVGSCGSTKDCVQCYAFGTGPLGHEECAQCFDEGGPVDFIHLVDRLDPDLPLCLYQDEDGCLFRYTIEETRPHSRRYGVQVLARLKCPQPVAHQ